MSDWGAGSDNVNFFEEGQDTTEQQEQRSQQNATTSQIEVANVQQQQQYYFYEGVPQEAYYYQDWLTAKEIYQFVLQREMPTSPHRNALGLLASSKLIAMPSKTNFALSFKHNTQYAQVFEILTSSLSSGELRSKSEVWKYSPLAIALFAEFFSVFPAAIECIESGVVATEAAEESQNAGIFVQGVPEQVLSDIMQWRKEKCTYLTNTRSNVHPQQRRDEQYYQKKPQHQKKSVSSSSSLHDTSNTTKQKKPPSPAWQKPENQKAVAAPKQGSTGTAAKSQVQEGAQGAAAADTQNGAATATTTEPEKKKKKKKKKKKAASESATAPEAATPVAVVEEPSSYLDALMKPKPAPPKIEFKTAIEQAESKNAVTVVAKNQKGPVEMTLDEATQKKAKQSKTEGKQAASASGAAQQKQKANTKGTASGAEGAATSDAEKPKSRGKKKKKKPENVGLGDIISAEIEKQKRKKEAQEQFLQSKLKKEKKDKSSFKDKKVVMPKQRTNPNPLDSSGAIHRRGWEREAPKKKKLTKLKKIILREKGKLPTKKEIEENPGIAGESAAAGSSSQPPGEASTTIATQSQDEQLVTDTETDFMTDHSTDIETDLKTAASTTVADPNEKGHTDDESQQIGVEEKKINLEIQQKSFMIREYVDQELSETLNTKVIDLLQKLQKFQTRLKKMEPLKYQSRKRYVVGIRETLRGLKAGRVVAVVMVPNIEKIVSPGGLDTLTSTIIQLATKNNVPIIFALSKRRLGKVLGKIVKVSVVGIYSAQGAFEEYREAVAASKKLKSKQEEKQEASATVKQ